MLRTINRIFTVRCLAGVEALPAPDLKFLAETAEKDLGQNPKNNWFLVFAAMTRRERATIRRALELLDQTRPEYSPATNLAGARAIILHHLGRGDEARKALADAELDLEETYRGVLSGVLPMPITDAETLMLARCFAARRTLLSTASRPPTTPIGFSPVPACSGTGVVIRSSRRRSSPRWPPDPATPRSSPRSPGSLPRWIALEPEAGFP